MVLFEERVTTLVFLPGKSHGQRSVAGYSSWGHKSQTDLATEPPPWYCTQHNKVFVVSCYSSVASLRLTLCGPMGCSTPGFSVLHHLLGFAQTHVHWVCDAIQPSHPLSPPSPFAINLSQHQYLFPMSKLFTSGGRCYLFNTMLKEEAPALWSHPWVLPAAPYAANKFLSPLSLPALVSLLDWKSPWLSHNP